MIGDLLIRFALVDESSRSLTLPVAQAQTAECIVIGELLIWFALVNESSRNLTLPVVQAQTAECIVIGELLSPRMIVALNKVDLLPVEGRMKAMRKAGRNILDALRMTRFHDSAIVPVAAKAGGVEGQTQGLAELKTALLRNVQSINRQIEAPLLFMVDHCFAIKGQGTVMTGAWQMAQWQCFCRSRNIG